MAIEKTSITVAVIFAIILLFAFSLETFLSAKASYNSVCHPEVNIGKYTVLGSAVSNYNTDGDLINTTIEISNAIETDSDLYSEVYQHENCHLVQAKRSYKWLSCNYPLLKIIGEMECYSVDGLPSGIYNFLY